MFESLGGSSFQAFESTPSASLVQDALQGTVQDTVQESVSECIGVQGYSIEKIMSICSIARRTAFKYASEVIQTWFWLPEYEFRVNGVYSEFALTELKRRKALGTLDNYRGVVHRENADKLQPPQPERQPDVTVETLDVSPLALFKPEVLALYNQSQQPQNSLSTKAETKLYFTPGDYSNRYQSTEMMVANQAGKEVIFANELLAKFAEMTADNQAWNQAESQKQDVHQRDAAVRGMQRALNEFLNENTAYRGLKHQLETGQITPEQVLTMLMQFQGKGQSPDSSSVSS